MYCYSLNEQILINIWCLYLFCGGALEKKIKNIVLLVKFEHIFCVFLYGAQRTDQSYDLYIYKGIYKGLKKYWYTTTVWIMSLFCKVQSKLKKSLFSIKTENAVTHLKCKRIPSQRLANKSQHAPYLAFQFSTLVCYHLLICAKHKVMLCWRKLHFDLMMPLRERLRDQQSGYNSSWGGHECVYPISGQSIQ